MNIIGAVIVLFHPKIEQVILNLKVIAATGIDIVLIDNTPAEDINYNKKDFTSINTRISYFSLGLNQGIGKAHNVGAGIVFNKLKCSFMLLLDQDSNPPASIISDLLEAHKLLEFQGTKVGAVGANIFNPKLNKYYVDQTGNEESDENLIKVETLISSGSLISHTAFTEIGPFDEELFIDFVDHEWCYRGAVHGARYFISKKAVLEHYMGQEEDQFFRKSIFIATPKRTYYTYRNLITLLKRNYMPVRWKLMNIYHFSLKLAYYLIIAKDRNQYRKNIISGMKEGCSTKQKHTF